MATITYTVTVASGTTQYGTGNKFYINGELAPVLYLDEAHSIGIYGKDGSGCAFGKKYEKEIVVGTFGKSFGSFGSFVSTSEDYVKKIINSKNENISSYFRC